MANPNDSVIIDMSRIDMEPGALYRRVYVDYKSATSGSSWAQTIAGFHHARLVVADGLRAPAEDPLNVANPTPKIVRDGAGRPVEPSKPFFDPQSGYPNLLPADNSVADGWGFTIAGSKPRAMTGNDLLLEHFDRAQSYQYWTDSWQRFLGYTKLNKDQIENEARRIFRDRFQREGYNLAINSCNDFAYALADAIVDRASLPAGDVHSIWAFMDLSKRGGR